MEKARLPSTAGHPSYQRHRREVRSKIIAPMLIAAALFIALVVWIGIVTFVDNGDVARWAAMSTIWLIMPMLVTALVILLILLASIYGMMRLLKVIPPYTGYAQRIVWRAQGYVKRAADMAVKPILGAEGVLATVRRFLGSK